MSFRIRRAHKFGAIKCTVDGIKFDSIAESEYYQHLKILKHVGQITAIELQPKIYMTSAMILYKPDFAIVENGQTIYLDVKGMQTAVFKIKMRLWKHYGPGTLRLIKKSKFGFQTTREITREGADDEQL